MGQVIVNILDNELTLEQIMKYENTCLFVGSSQDSSISPVIEGVGNVGSGSFAVRGNPVYDNTYKIMIVDDGEATGAIGGATFKYSKNNGVTWSDKRLLPPTATWSLLEDNVEIRFTNGTPADSFETGDTFEFSTIGVIEANKVYTVTPNNYKSLIKSGKLYDALEKFFAMNVDGYNKPAYAKVIRAENTESGSVGSVTASQSGTGSFSVSETSAGVSRSMKVRVEIGFVGGACETAKYRYKIDNNQYSDWITTPASATPAYIGNGVLITFTNGGTPSSSFVIGDYFEFEATAPHPITVMYALTDSLVSPDFRGEVKYDLGWGYMCLLETITLANILLLRTMFNIREQQTQMRSYAIVQARGIEDDTVSDWINAVENEFNNLFDERFEVCFNQVYVTIGTPPVTYLVDNNIISSAKRAIIPVNKDESRIKDGSLSIVTDIPHKDELRMYSASGGKLENMRVVTIKEEFNKNKEYGFYFTEAYVMYKENSNYKRVRDVATSFKLAREILLEFKELVNEDIEVSDDVLFALGIDVQNRVTETMRNEITGLEITVKTTAEQFKKTKKIIADALYDQTYLIGDIEINLGVRPLE